MSYRLFAFLLSDSQLTHSCSLLQQEHISVASSLPEPYSKLFGRQVRLSVVFALDYSWTSSLSQIWPVFPTA